MHRKRQTAMRRYFTYVKQSRDILQQPCMVDFNHKECTAFTNSHSMVLTTEKPDRMQMFEDRERYPDLSRFISYEGIKLKTNLSKVIARAKEDGYKLVKSELNPGFKYLLYYDDSYYKLGLIHATFAIIDNNEDVFIYHAGTQLSPLIIENSIGVCAIMPMRIPDESIIESRGNIVIHLVDPKE